ncbi:MAG: hypothetical protein K0S23_1698 [Fluviicola sp.]|jgi:hypothetical protein|nr:hypothetical protein [Fluviicola sp.]
MKLAKKEFGYLINFNEKLLRNGVKRFTLKGKYHSINILCVLRALRGHFMKRECMKEHYYNLM